jgi:hypothetical protein
MANKKFSQFNQLSTPSANTEIVGFDGSNNIRLLASALGGGKEVFPLPVTNKVSRFTDQTFGSTATPTARNGVIRVMPLVFRDDVILSKVATTQTNGSSAASANGGRVGLYKRSSINGAGNHVFDKVYQETQTFSLTSALVNVEQSITLTTPQTLDAGEMYVVVIMDDNASLHPNNVLLDGVKFISFSTFLSQNAILADNATATMTGGVLPSTITLTPSGTSDSISAINPKLTIQNA